MENDDKIVSRLPSGWCPHYLTTIQNGVVEIRKTGKRYAQAVRMKKGMNTFSVTVWQEAFLAKEDGVEKHVIPPKKGRTKSNQKNAKKNTTQVVHV